MKKIPLTTPQGNSQILIEQNLLEKSGELLKKEFPDSRFAVMLDSNLEKIYGDKLNSLFPDALFLTVAAGEESKEFENVKKLAQDLLNNGFTRYDVVIGFGGGMVTDLAGFVASIYMRGMRYVAFPTSLLGMVDAAIGGKTGVNLGAKNIIGTIYLADFVLIDPTLLKTFDDPKKMPGMGEVIKYAATIDASLFDDFEKEPLDLLTIITKSAQAKSNVVSEDLREGGVRKILNYGHTFGHAIESATDFALTHDQAISIGMVLANKVAQNLDKQKPDVGKKIKETLDKFRLPTELPSDLEVEGLVDLMKKDKKRRGDVIDYVIVTELGNAEIIPIKPKKLAELANS